MKRRQLSPKMAAVTCVILSLIFFYFDLLIPWAIGSVLFVNVVALSFFIGSRSSILYFAGFVTILTLLALIIQPPVVNAVRVYTNYSLVIIIIWFTALLGLQFQKRDEISSYFGSIIESSNDVVIGNTVEGTIQSWNDAGHKIYGYTGEEIVGRPMSVLIPSSRLEEWNNLLERIKNGEEIRHYETEHRSKQGSLIDISLSLSPILGKFSELAGIAVIARDISAEKQQRLKEIQLRRRIEVEKQKLDEVLRVEEGLSRIYQMDQLIDFIVSKTLKVMEADRCSLMLYDEEANDFCIKGHCGLDDDIVRMSRIKFGDPVAGIIAEIGHPIRVKDIETDPQFARAKRPFYRTGSFVSAPIKINDRLVGLLNVADKNTPGDPVFTPIDLKILTMIARQAAVAIDNIMLNDELDFLAVTDALTNLNNYRYFTKTLDFEIARATRFKTPLSLMMIDVDNLKSYNDAYGHQEGDRLLANIARSLKENMREVDIVCRYAGDEFAVILSQTTSGEAGKLSEKILMAADSLPAKQKTSISIGVAEMGPNFQRQDLIRKASQALYESKKRGKNQTCVLG